MPEAHEARTAPNALSPASAAALALLAEFASLGVQHVVICPGSRSQALALAAAELERVGVLRVHVRLDERGAGFLALGIARETGIPALVITTSGTAVANLHPAVLEAHHSRVPLIVVSADRPEELRGIRSNQTTIQPGIFGPVTRFEADVAAPAKGGADLARPTARAAFAAAADPATAGPVHLNLQYREPLSSAVPPEAVTAALSPALSPAESVPDDTFAASPERSIEPLIVGPGPRTLVIAGDSAGADAEEFARAGGWPLAAEVSSGAHFGPNLVVGYRELIADAEFGGRVERVVVFGHPTLSREVPALIARDDVETIVVDPATGASAGLEGYDPGHRVATFAAAVQTVDHEATPEERRWTGRWIHTSRALAETADETVERHSSGVALGGHVEDFAAQREYVKAEFAAIRAPITRRMLVGAVWAATWPHDRLLFGASRLIRDADGSVPGRKVRVFANRGLAGIDGTVATATGIAVAGQSADGPGTTRAVIGDLTLLHDASSLLLAAGEARPRLLLVVGNDGGGTIFDTLEVAGSAPTDAFDRTMFTPQSVDLGSLAAAYGWEYRRATTRGELNDALTAPVVGPTILEVPLPR